MHSWGHVATQPVSPKPQNAHPYQRLSQNTKWLASSWFGDFATPKRAPSLVKKEKKKV